MKHLRLFPLILAIALAGAAGAANIRMGPGILDITAAPYNADPTGVSDATAAIRQAIVDNRYLGPDSRIIYFPNGTYRITGNIVAESTDNQNFVVRLQGQSRDGVVLKLDDNHPSYQSGRVPVLTFFSGNGNNNAFMNCIENLTIDVGTGNPAAAALEFHSNNCGFIRDVTLRSSDPSGAGHTGLRLTKANGGMGLIKNLRIEGFDTGIKTVYAHAGYVYEHVELIGQNVIGWDADDKPGFIWDLYSNNTVKVLDTSTWSSSTGPGQIVLIDSTFDGGAGGVWPVEHNYGFLFARNLAVSTSYAGAIQDDVAGILVPGTVSGGHRVVDEYSSHAGVQAFGDTGPGSLNLAVEETPEFPYDGPADWATVAPNGINDTANIQAALNSGKTTVFFEPGDYFVDTTLNVGPDVRAIRGQWARVNALGSLRYSSSPVFQFTGSNHPSVLIERFTSPYGPHDCHMVGNDLSGTDLVMRDIFWVMGRCYRGTSPGRLFIENVHALAGGHNELSSPAFVFDGVEVWARQINPEAFIPQFEIRNSRVWILGFKTGEGYGQPFDIADNSVVEILGGIVNRTGSDVVPNDMPVIRSVDSAVTAVMVERAEVPDSGSTRYRHATIVEETRGSTTRLLTDADFPKRGGSFAGFAMPLFLGNLIPPFEDPDRDGVVNIVEYALGLDRFTPDADGLPGFSTIELTGDVYPVLDVVRDFTKNDLSYTVLWSDDLLNWFSGPGYTTSVSESASSLRVRSDFPLNPASPRQFLRLRIDR
jgi:hypothetical protein